MANRSRSMILKGEYKPVSKFVVPLVTSLHPATTVLTKMVKESFEEASKLDNTIDLIFPKSTLLVAYSKLPNLQLLLCSNDQNKQANPSPPPPINGYTHFGCRCMVCKASSFSKYVCPPSMPGYSVKIPETTSCQSGPALVYYLVCKSNRQECQRAHYVGRASTNDPRKKPMGLRWANHKSHHKNGHDFCAMTAHLLSYHKGEDPQKFIQIQILQSAPNPEMAKSLELWWIRKLFAFWPSGLNIREEE